MRSKLALYLHIPFCVRKCRYCAFLSQPPGEKEVVRRYLQALQREMAVAAALVEGEELGSIYFGGGTPTLLDPEDLFSLLETARRCFRWRPEPEITVEANPGTVTPQGLRRLREAGVNRLSLGVQSFDPAELRLLGRIHTVAASYAAYEAAREAGFTNLNLDLIYALPGQTLAAWRRNLARAVELKPEHLSVYGLSLEEGTPLAAEVAAGSLQECPENLQVAMWEATGSCLAAAGYHRYEISNFSLPGRECRHNLTYWLNLPYLGLGLGAHGYLRGIRYANCCELATYLDLALKGKLPRAWEEHQTREQERTDTIIMGLRLTRGLSRRAFQERFGHPFEKVYGSQLAALEQAGLMGENREFIYLTDRGRLLSNSVLACFI